MRPTVRGNCEEKLRLLAEYQSATETYSKAVSALTRKISDAPATDYDNIRNVAERARHESVSARKRFEEHIVQHGC